MEILKEILNLHSHCYVGIYVRIILVLRTGIYAFIHLLLTGNFVLFDPDLALRQFDNELQILKTFFPVRLEFYKKRRLWLINKLEAEAKRLQNQARFILEKLSGEIAIENKKKAAIISMLQASKYDSDPVKKWQKSISDLVSSLSHPPCGGVSKWRD